MPEEVPEVFGPGRTSVCRKSSLASYFLFDYLSTECLIIQSFIHLFTHSFIHPLSVHVFVHFVTCSFEISSFSFRQSTDVLEWNSFHDCISRFIRGQYFRRRFFFFRSLDPRIVLNWGSWNSVILLFVLITLFFCCDFFKNHFEKNIRHFCNGNISKTRIKGSACTTVPVWS